MGFGNQCDAWYMCRRFRALAVNRWRNRRSVVKTRWKTRRRRLKICSPSGNCQKNCQTVWVPGMGGAQARTNHPVARCRMENLLSNKMVTPGSPATTLASPSVTCAVDRVKGIVDYRHIFVLAWSGALTELLRARANLSVAGKVRIAYTEVAEGWQPPPPWMVSE